MAELRQVLEHQKKVESEQKDVYQAFLNQHVHPEAKARITAAVRRAAERGEKEIQVMRFSSEFCTDSGGTAERLGVQWWVGYDRPSFWLAGEQKWDGFCAWWKPGSRVRAEASTS